MFESITPPNAAQRLKRAAAFPLGAFFIAQLYFLVYPLLARVPAMLFWSVVCVLLAGVVSGAVALTRAMRGESFRGSALAWFLGAGAVEVLCAWLLVSMVVPWI
jgi:hypothetical protein